MTLKIYTHASNHTFITINSQYIVKICFMAKFTLKNMVTKLNKLIKMSLTTHIFEEK